MDKAAIADEIFSVGLAESLRNQGMIFSSIEL